MALSALAESLFSDHHFLALLCLVLAFRRLNGWQGPPLSRRTRRSVLHPCSCVGAFSRRKLFDLHFLALHFLKVERAALGASQDGPPFGPRKAPLCPRRWPLRARRLPKKITKKPRSELFEVKVKPVPDRWPWRETVYERKKVQNIERHCLNISIAVPFSGQEAHLLAQENVPCEPGSCPGK